MLSVERSDGRPVDRSPTERSQLWFYTLLEEGVQFARRELLLYYLGIR